MLIFILPFRFRRGYSIKKASIIRPPAVLMHFSKPYDCTGHVITSDDCSDSLLYVRGSKSEINAQLLKEQKTII